MKKNIYSTEITEERLDYIRESIECAGNIADYETAYSYALDDLATEWDAVERSINKYDEAAGWAALGYRHGWRAGALDHAARYLVDLICELTEKAEDFELWEDGSGRLFLDTQDHDGSNHLQIKELKEDGMVENFGGSYADDKKTFKNKARARINLGANIDYI